MNQIADKQLAEASGKLTYLLAEVRTDAALYPRVLQWIGKFTGGREISEWLADGKVEARDRVMIARNLVDLLLAKDYSRLPADAAPVAPPLTPSADEVRHIVREELAALLSTIATVLRE